MVIFYKKWKKYNEIQLTKNKMDLNIRKMINHPPSPGEERVKTQSNTIMINITCWYYIRDGKSTMKFNEQKTKWTWTIENEKSSTLPQARSHIPC